jgi:V8-like Glu-specific endopeptidase
MKQQGGRLDRRPGTGSRYGCFLSDLTGLASGPPTANLPAPISRSRAPGASPGGRAKRALLAFAAFSLLVSAPAAARYLFGADHRRRLTTEEEHRFRPVGWVSAGASGGTGFLVGSGRVLVTAAHVLFRDGQPLAPRFWFYPDGLEGPRVEVDSFVAGTADPARDSPERDWAVVRLKQDLGAELGWLGWASPSGRTAERQGRAFLLIGYNADRELGRSKFATPCSLHPRREEDALPGAVHIWLHDCDTRAGASGAPIVIEEQGEPLVVGLHVNHVYRPGTRDGDPFDPRFNTGIAVRFEGDFEAELKRALAAGDGPAQFNSGRAGPD